MSLTFRWRVPERPIQTRWRGPAGVASALTRDPALPIAAIIGPQGAQGPQGPAGSPLRIDASLAATWVLSHSLGHVPVVQVYLASGEPVLTDIAASASQITVTFPSPQQGFILAF